MRVYIAGPITGRPGLNRQAFTDAAAVLRQAGHIPLNPHGALVAGWGWSDYMRRALALLLTADQIMLLPGWEDSRGARLEAEVARAVGLPVRLTFSPAPVCAAHTWQAWDWFGEPSPEIRPRCARCFLWAHDDAEQETKP